MDNGSIEFKKETIEALGEEPPKKKRGRPFGAKSGTGKKKAPKKKASEKIERTSRFKADEREATRKKLVTYFGASKVDKALVKASKINELDPILVRLRTQMENELEDQAREVEDYYKQIDAEYKKVGRPKSVYNERELRYLCSIHCTREEIAGFFQMNKDILSRKVSAEYGISWNEFYESNSQGSKVALRRRQIQAAMDGDTQMLKFLGKNMLGQKEQIDFDGEVKVNSWVDLVVNLEGKKKRPIIEPPVDVEPAIEVASSGGISAPF